MAKPRIITKVVRWLRAEAQFLRESVSAKEAAKAEQLADELDAYDARETRLDPSRRKRGGR